jgi:hypothetical protein
VRHGNTRCGVSGVPFADARRRQAVAYRDLAGTHVARKADEARTAADISAQINDEPVTARLLRSRIAESSEFARLICLWALESRES